MPKIALTLAVALVALAACSAADPDDPTPMGHEFVSTEVQGAPIPGGGPLELGFADEQISAFAGCNRASASVDLSDGKVTTGDLATTMMACPGDRGDADAWVATLLGAQPAWALDGDTLTLRTGDQVVTLLDRTVADPNRPLIGTNWLVQSTIASGAITTSVALERAAAHLVLDPSGAVTGNTGCNNFNGPATVSEPASGTTIEFGPLATTRMACEPDLAEVEQSVLAVLSGTVEATVDADKLTLRKPDGTGLVLRAQ
ncbi:META domain-containing protein [Aldersonia sp. NBC_00410]|uniref:META domain-containing protein n=1 Tax=Aldersonia sp. NBC_00410 TaxID=2975954 RepID=UPI0022525475|nr:META domain-containing protein [Aldersonia sp. NBC_00410]MCX5042529.1 META domain-containing protein [Aldersonia sp. NBC_00410]